MGMVRTSQTLIIDSKKRELGFFEGAGQCRQAVIGVMDRLISQHVVCCFDICIFSSETHLGEVNPISYLYARFILQEG